MGEPLVTVRAVRPNDGGCMCCGCDAERKYVSVISVNRGNLIVEIRLCVVHCNEMVQGLDYAFDA